MPDDTPPDVPVPPDDTPPNVPDVVNVLLDEEANYNKKQNDFTEKERSIDIKQEDTRSDLARILLYMLFTIVIVALVSTFLYNSSITIEAGGSTGIKTTFDKSIDTKNFKEIVTLLLSSLVGLIGTVLGFYFGRNGNNS